MSDAVRADRSGCRQVTCLIRTASGRGIAVRTKLVRITGDIAPLYGKRVIFNTCPAGSLAWVGGGIQRAIAVIEHWRSVSDCWIVVDDIESGVFVQVGITCSWIIRPDPVGHEIPRHTAGIVEGEHDVRQHLGRRRGLQRGRSQAYAGRPAARRESNAYT